VDRVTNGESRACSKKHRSPHAYRLNPSTLSTGWRAEQFVARVAAALGAQGVKVTLVTRSWPTTETMLDVKRCDPWYIGSIWRDLGFALCALSPLAVLAR